MQVLATILSILLLELNYNDTLASAYIYLETLAVFSNISFQYYLGGKPLNER